MKRFVPAFGALAIAALVAVPAMAQEASSGVTGVVQEGNTTLVFERGNAGLKLDQLSAFNKVTETDPSLASALAKKPSLVDDDAFVAKHPALAQYLQQFPGARADIRDNPGNYLTPVAGSTWRHAAPGIKMSGNEE
jgi:hypothetical protein